MLVTLGWMLGLGLPFPAHPPLDIPGTFAARPLGRVTVSTDRDNPYRRGEAARVYLTIDEPSHVVVFRVDTDGRFRVLFPREPWGDTFVRTQGELEIGGARGDRSFVVDDYPGVGYLFAVASPDPFELDDLTRGDYWDYRLLDGGRLRGDPYLLLQELAERITRGAEHDYDIAPYYVDRHYDYPRFVCYDCHAYASYDEWDPYERECRRYRLVVYDAPREYAYRSGRGRNVVMPSRGPRYVFQDAEQGREYITRVPRAADADRRAVERRRTSEDVGGQGAIPAPAIQSPGRRGVDRGGAEPSPARPLIEERRRARDSAREPQVREREPADDVPDGLRPVEGERRVRPRQRPAEPQSTGEPELRRRRP